MKVQDLIDKLAEFRGDADVTCWIHNEGENIEFVSMINSVARDRNGNVGLNWSEEAKHPVIGSFKINNE